MYGKPAAVGNPSRKSSPILLEFASERLFVPRQNPFADKTTGDFDGFSEFTEDEGGSYIQYKAR